MEVEFPGRPLPTLQVLRPQWARWFDLVRRSDRNLVKWKYQLRSFNVRQDFGQRQGIYKTLDIFTSGQVNIDRALPDVLAWRYWGAMTN